MTATKKKTTPPPFTAEQLHAVKTANWTLANKILRPSTHIRTLRKLGARTAKDVVSRQYKRVFKGVCGALSRRDFDRAPVTAKGVPIFKNSGNLDLKKLGLPIVQPNTPR